MYVFVPSYKSEEIKCHSIAFCEQATAFDYDRAIRLIYFLGDKTRYVIHMIKKRIKCRWQLEEREDSIGQIYSV